MELVGWLLFAVVLFYAGPAFVLMPRRTLRRFTSDIDDPAFWPVVSVVIAARDEEQRIGETLIRLLASDYPHLEVILANDRSADGTLQIAEAISQNDHRLRIVTIDDVPVDGVRTVCARFGRRYSFVDRNRVHSQRIWCHAGCEC